MNASDQTATPEGVDSITLLEPRPIRRRVPRTLMLAAALSAWDHPGLLPRMLCPAPREPREKTPADLAALAAASEKRARKDAARERQRLLSKGSNSRITGVEK